MLLPMIMKWALKGFRRSQLQRVSDIAAPFVAFFLKGTRFTDPIDNRSYSRLLPYGYINSRENALAPGSMSLERHRLLYLFLREHTNLFNDPLKVLHISPEMCLKRVLQKQQNIEYITADLESPWADYHFDVHAIPFPNESFDVVMANHLLEHVQDDMRVLQEFFRVMKKGGWGVFQVPVDETKPKTCEDPFLTDENLREKYFGQKDHVRLYGADYGERLGHAGFKVIVKRLSQLSPTLDFTTYAVDPQEPIFFCRKRM